MIYLHHTQLLHHPHNMRTRYPLADVRRMALSQAARAKRGLDPCIQPLIVTPVGAAEGPRPSHPACTHGLAPVRRPAEEGYYIIAGHLRRAGNAYLGDQAPRLNCLVRHYPDENAMLAEMRGENGVRADISPLGWARHFADSLAADPALTRRQLSRESGKTLHTVGGYLDLFRLCPEAQALVDSGDLPLGAVRLLLKITDPKIQARAARRFAARRSTLEAIRLGVGAILSKRPPKVRRIVKTERLRSAEASLSPSTEGLPPDSPATLDDLRASTALICAKCNVRPRGHLEPAWHLALAAAGETCANCDLRTVKGACGGCPLPEMLSRLARGRNGLRPAHTTASPIVRAAEGPRPNGAHA